MLTSATFKRRRLITERTFHSDGTIDITRSDGFEAVQLPDGSLNVLRQPRRPWWRRLLQLAGLGSPGNGSIPSSPGGRSR
jgi:hypothetical protein